MDTTVISNSALATARVVRAILEGTDGWSADLKTGKVYRHGTEVGWASGEGKRIYFGAYRTKVQRSRVIAGVAYGNPSIIVSKFEADHCNGNRSDDRASNLEWVTSGENKRRMVERRRRVSAEALAIAGRMLADGLPASTVAAWSGISNRRIRQLRDQLAA